MVKLFQKNEKKNIGNLLVHMKTQYLNSFTSLQHQC